MNNLKLYFIALCLLLGGGVLNACDMHHETYMTPNRMQLVKNDQTLVMPVDQLNDAQILQIANDFDRNGDGDLYMSVAYDPMVANAANNASRAANRLQKEFNAAGVKNVRANTLAVNELGHECRAMITYNAYEVKPPKDCETMPGLRYTDMTVEAEEDYKLGCSIDTVLSRQISNPTDLLGVGQNSNIHDGRRVINRVEPYRAGADAPDLKTLSASGR